MAHPQDPCAARCVTKDITTYQTYQGLFAHMYKNKGNFKILFLVYMSAISEYLFYLSIINQKSTARI